MISVMNNNCEVDGKSDAIEDSVDAKAKVSEGGLDGSNDERYSNLRISDEGRVSPMELDSEAPYSEVGSVKPESIKEEEEEEARLSDGGEVDKEVESKSTEVKLEKSSADRLNAKNEEIEGHSHRFETGKDRKEHEKGNGSQYNSLLSEFDDYVANEKSGQTGTSRALSFGFEVGDLVWGKVKSHPWWPGHIFNEAFATSQVRRTRREGHILVAFFGDSSYGWFDPAELIPFDPNYSEKSRQTTSRNFVKAVEEAVDEASRRCAVGLSCKCRNPYNFRMTNVQGYFAVDVPDYEPYAVYSASQISKARDSFKPSETLAFIKQMAVLPFGGDPKNLSFVKDRATVFALRKAAFEEFDETYAQAFGVHSGRQSREQVNSMDQLVRAPPRAPLSGPLVIAETLGGGMSASKPMKIKESSKKDRYLFKRRDENSNATTHQIILGQASSSVPSGYMEGTISVKDGDFVLQKRAPTVSLKSLVPAKDEQSGITSMSSLASVSDISGKDAVIMDQASASSSVATLGVNIDSKQSFDMRKDALQEVKEEESTPVSDGGVVSTSTGGPDLSGERTLPCAIDGASQSLKRDRENLVESNREETQESQVSFPKTVEQEPVQDVHSDQGPSPNDAKRSSGMSSVGGVKAKVLKRPVEELRSGKSTTEEKKMKKKKKQLGSETSFRDPQKHLPTKKVGPSVGKLVGKATQIGLSPREDFRVEHHNKNAASGNTISDNVATSSLVGMGNVELELPKLLNDLHALALDPFYGVERNCPIVVRQFFLRFRSLVYQKSLVLSPPSESESVEIRPSKSSVGGVSENNSTEHVRDLPSSKPAKPLSRSDDPTIAGRKRAPSDRQEEIAAKRSKKISDIKTLAAEKKASQKTSEVQRGEGKESAVPLLRKSIKPDSAKKGEPSARVVQPTTLVVKFPPQISLPSPAELKARFARFGPMDQSGLRVFWKSSTCRVVFLYKSDAQAAYKYAVGNNSLFGNFSVRCYLREVEVPGPEVPESGKGHGDDNPMETRVKDPAVISRPASGLMQQPLPQPATQLKSCLKKSSGEESVQVTGGVCGGNGKGTPRVKFMLGGEDSRSEQLMTGNRTNFNNNNNNNNIASFADGGAPSSSSSSTTTTTTSVAMDFNSRNFQKVISPSPSPILQLPPQFAKAPVNNSHHSEMAPRNTHNLNTTPPSAPPTVDISHQMLSLLTRCNDVVTNVTGLLGYVPYHPL
ncbi:hypothetical protein FEM48_Zijuj02G0141900 [Ziziphus jujuba var. spinosa]|uniref:PWWP domain-containing protein n=1 Tax=Ziziphus jujuba var. spinosa TaxID=714518 RepID=A0A978VW54_ZIZJJ|nr:hypothetical protein FEM48_Zijuj02G0141900 [Ziziphus jujuba var. spinosa]